MISDEIMSNNCKLTAPKVTYQSKEKDLSSMNVHNKRIMKELSIYFSEPNEDIKIYQIENDLNKWRSVIKAPEGSLYDGYWFALSINFPDEYPAKPPEIRFFKPPYHPNISESGRICIDSLDKYYISSNSIVTLLGQIRGLLLQPNYSDPIDMTRTEFQTCVKWVQKDGNLVGEIICPQNIKQKIDQINKQNGKSTLEEWTKDWNIEDDQNVDIQNSEQFADVPSQFLCQLSNKIMKEPVKSSTGIYFEKRQLENYLRNKGQPLCPITGKPLDKQKDMNLPIDNEMKQRIEEWKRSHHYQK